MSGPAGTGNSYSVGPTCPRCGVDLVDYPDTHPHILPVLVGRYCPTCPHAEVRVAA